MLKSGDPLPDIQLEASDGRRVALRELFGQRALVIYFYPKDHTFGCTLESCDFRDQYQQFLDLGAQVVGISRDDRSSHLSFIAEHQLPFVLLSDPDGSAHRAFGIKKVLGVLPARVTFVVTPPDLPGGIATIRFVYRSEIAFKTHVSEALGALRRL